MDISPATLTRNILRTYRAASEDQHETGLAWYSEAHDLANEIASGDTWRGAGVLAAFSPMTPWWRNVELAVNAFRTGIASGSLSNSNNAAQRILDGEFALDVLLGPKTSAFAENIALNGFSDAVTVDSHAYSVAINKHTFTKNVKLGKRDYQTIADAYRRAADRERIAPTQMQAITWVKWRDDHPNKAARKAGL